MRVVCLELLNPQDIMRKPFPQMWFHIWGWPDSVWDKPEHVRFFPHESGDKVEERAVFLPFTLFILKFLDKSALLTILKNILLPYLNIVFGITTMSNRRENGKLSF